MLYDPKWEQQTKADPHSVASLIAWLERKPAKQIYCYTDTGGCLLAQYFTAQGFKDVDAGGWAHWSHMVDGNRVSMKAGPVFHQIAKAGARTFGAALERARAVIAND